MLCLLLHITKSETGYLCMLRSQHSTQNNEKDSLCYILRDRCSYIFIYEHMSITNSQQILTKCSLHTCVCLGVVNLYKYVPWPLSGNLTVHRQGCSSVRIRTSPCQTGENTKAMKNHIICSELCAFESLSDMKSPFTQKH